MGHGHVGKTKERPWHVELPEQNPPASAGTQAPRSMGCFYPTEVDGHTCNLQEVKLLPEGCSLTNVSMVMGLAKVT